jgi:hypothetical protein
MHRTMHTVACRFSRARRSKTSAVTDELKVSPISVPMTPTVSIWILSSNRDENNLPPAINLIVNQRFVLFLRLSSRLVALLHSNLSPGTCHLLIQKCFHGKDFAIELSLHLKEKIHLLNKTRYVIGPLLRDIFHKYLSLHSKV